MDDSGLSESTREFLQTVHRDLNCLSDEEKVTRRRAIKRLVEKIGKVPGSKSSVASVRECAVPHLVKPLLRALSDETESVREGSAGCLVVILDVLTSSPTASSGNVDSVDCSRVISEFLVFATPVLLARLTSPPGSNASTTPAVEPTEEVRHTLIRFSAKLFSFCDGDVCSSFLDDYTAITGASLRDAFHECRKAGCDLAMAIVGCDPATLASSSSSSSSSLSSSSSSSKGSKASSMSLAALLGEEDPKNKDGKKSSSSSNGGDASKTKTDGAGEEFVVGDPDEVVPMPKLDPVKKRHAMRVVPNLAGHLKSTLGHQHYKVRLCAIEALSPVILCGGSGEVEKMHNQVKTLVSDRNGSVRLASVKTVATWLRGPDREVFDALVLPVILRALSDNGEDVALFAEKVMDILGAQYEEDYADELRKTLAGTKSNDKADDSMDVDGDDNDCIRDDNNDSDDNNTGDKKRNTGGKRRPRVGARMVVRRRLPRIVPDAILDMGDWGVANRVSAALLLRECVRHAEEHCTAQLSDMLAAVSKLSKDEEKDARNAAAEVAVEIGRFVPPATFLPISLASAGITYFRTDDGPSITATTGVANAAACNVAAALIRGCPRKKIEKHIPAIVRSLAIAVSGIPANQQNINIIIINNNNNINSNGANTDMDVDDNTVVSDDVNNKNANVIAMGSSVGFPDDTELCIAYANLLEAAVDGFDFVNFPHAVPAAVDVEILCTIMGVASCPAMESANRIDAASLAQRKSLVTDDHRRAILGSILETSSTWIGASPAFAVLLSFIDRAGDAIGSFASTLADAIASMVDLSRDPPLRTKAISLLVSLLGSNVASGNVNDIAASSVPPAASGASAAVVAMGTKVILECVVPCLVWRAGKEAAVVRKEALDALIALAGTSSQPTSIDDEEVTEGDIVVVGTSGSANKLGWDKICPKLFPLLVTNLDDGSVEVRIRAYRAVELTIKAAPEQFDDESVWKFQNPLLKALDDSSDRARCVLCDTLAAFASVMPSTYSSGSFDRYASDFALHVDDPNADVRAAVKNVIIAFCEKSEAARKSMTEKVSEAAPKMRNWGVGGEGVLKGIVE